MEQITRQVRDIDTADRRALEHVIGRKLQENQQVIFQVVSFGGNPSEQSRQSPAADAGDLPEWTNVYEGLSDAEIDDLDARQHGPLRVDPRAHTRGLA